MNPVDVNEFAKLVDRVALLEEQRRDMIKDYWNVREALEQLADVTGFEVVWDVNVKPKAEEQDNG